MSAKIKQGLRRLAFARGISGDVYKELCTLTFGEKPETEHRAVAIVGSAILEEALRKAIEAHLIPTRTRDTDIQLFEDEQAPLQGLAARTRMAMALGIINEGVKSDLNYVRLIRNAFAHSAEHLSFSDPAILKPLNQLYSSRFIEGEGVDEMKKLAGDQFNAIRFVVAVSLIAGALTHLIPWWTPNRGLARALAIAARNRQGEQRPPIQDETS